MRARCYLDWNASAPLTPAAETAMAEALPLAAASGLNPSSQHQEGRRARALLEDARRRVAAAAGADPQGVVFTSGATEAANAVFAAGWDAIVVSALEHDCVLGAALRAEAAGARLYTAPSTAAGVVDLEALQGAVRAAKEEAERVLVAVMAANNETGARQPVAEAVRIAHGAGARILVDAAQALGKTDFDFAATAADFAALSGHKIGGPTGVGALLLAPGVDLRPLLAGGGQEQRRRAGTENLLGAVGFGAAAASIDREAWRSAEALRARLESRLNSGAPDLVFFARNIDRLPTTVCVAAPGWRAETQLMQLDLAGYAVSAGSACSSGKLAASHVLTAMGADAELSSSAIRIRFGPSTTAEELDGFAETYLRLRAKSAAKLAG